MNSFLRKLKREGIVKQDEKEATPQPTLSGGVKMSVPAGVTQLPVDVFQTDSEIIIYAQIPGLDITKLDISIEGDNDVITIQGEYRRPEDIVVGTDVHGDYSLEECVWGQFFRQIILPQEIDEASSEAKVKDGVLIMKCPYKNLAVKKTKMRVIRFEQSNVAPANTASLMQPAAQVSPVNIPQASAQPPSVSPQIMQPAPAQSVG